MKLTRQSEFLIQFFHHNRRSYNMLNSKTKDILVTFFHQWREAKEYVANELHSYKNSIKRVSTATEISRPQTFHTSDLPEGVYGHIERHTVCEVVYHFSLCGRKVKVIFSLENEDRGQCKKYIEPIAIWLYLLCQYASNKCAKSITIYFYMTSLKKTLPTSRTFILNQINVNTAFTTSCPVDAEIVVFRKEEWFKVFIHETFHCFGLDFSAISSKAVDQCILRTFRVQSTGNTFEAYTEFWAELVNALFCAFYSSRDALEFVARFTVYIDLERSYSLFQLVKVLHFMGLSYNDLCLDTKSAAKKREMLYKENTNVLAYYILKTILLFHYQGFLQWCQTHNTNILQFKNTTSSLKDFCAFIQKHSKTASLLKAIEETEHLFASLLQINHHPQIKQVLTNMRMTILEWD